MYVEDLLALNFMINTLILYLTARICGRHTALRRLLAGGFSASLYSLIIFWPQLWLAYAWPGKIAFSLLVVAATFGPRRIIEWLRLWGAFLLVSFLLAGTVFALHFFGSTPAIVRGGVFYISPPRPGMLFSGVTLAFLLLLAVWFFSEKQRKRKELRYRLFIRNAGREVEVNALVDTGNALCDPLTGKPLCVAGYRSLAYLLPAALSSAYQSGRDPVEALVNLPAEFLDRFGVAPFRSLENSGLLVTFRPESVVVVGAASRVTREDLVFALSSKALSADNSVEILINPDALEIIGGVGC